MTNNPTMTVEVRKTLEAFLAGWERRRESFNVRPEARARFLDRGVEALLIDLTPSVIDEPTRANTAQVQVDGLLVAVKYLKDLRDECVNGSPLGHVDSGGSEQIAAAIDVVLAALTPSPSRVDELVAAARAIATALYGSEEYEGWRPLDNLRTALQAFEERGS